ncbi:OLC1v1021342C1 [Oldenlandia corymbosa var. corymbosa]|uniref:OLC1v1021342C1 n=1 Tax=Oldenlandia corymbosa var. corymbosa TaxID=529605 RepID=A0AAV1BVQ1_OLDCO|nr:OLC1v1021342C1 [Oldenlandia corymbosa var. corymbosa]
MNMKLFDAHCHLQDPRIYHISSEKIKSAREAGVVHIAVNGVSENDWQLVKEMSENNPCVISNFGLHPWFILDRNPDWLRNLKQFLQSTPEAAVGEIGLDRAPWASHVDYTDQVEVFQKQLQLAKEINRPASIHCVEAFDDLIEILKSLGPFPAGFLLHSYNGSHDLVPQLADLGAYFSISGHLMPMELSKAKKILKAIPLDRILLETDSPDALPTTICSDPNLSAASDEEMLNHPANIHYVLEYVASLLEMEKEELAQMSFNNARKIFSYGDTKISA